MKVTALRGVCIGVEQHLIAGENADLDISLATYLIAIGAAEITAEKAAAAPPADEVDPELTLTPARSGKKER